MSDSLQAPNHDLSASLPANQAPRRPATVATGVGLAILAVTLVGFWPSFFGDFASNDAPHLAHGSFATAWILLLVLQSVLAKTKSFALHRRLGWISVGLAAGLLATGATMVHVMLAVPHGAGYPLRVALAYIDIATLLSFLALYGGAIALRRQRPIHARLMVCTVIAGLVPALARVFWNHFPHFVYWDYLPGLGNLGATLLPSFAIVDALLVLLIAHDRYRGKVHWPYPVVLAFYLLLEATYTASATSPLFLRIAAWWA